MERRATLLRPENDRGAGEASTGGASFNRRIGTKGERKNLGLSGRQKGVRFRLQSAIQHHGADDGDAVSALRGPSHPLLLDYANDLGCRIENWFGIGPGYRLPFKISRHAMRLVAHGRQRDNPPFEPANLDNLHVLPAAFGLEPEHPLYDRPPMSLERTIFPTRHQSDQIFRSRQRPGT